MKPKFAFRAVVVVLCVRYNLAIGFRLKTKEFDKNNEIEAVNNSSDGGNNTNNNVVKVENNQKRNEIEGISQVERRRENLKLDEETLRFRRSAFRQWTIPDQFYDYAERSGHLKRIEVEKIANEDKKLENIFERDRDTSTSSSNCNTSEFCEAMKISENKTVLRNYDNVSRDLRFLASKVLNYPVVFETLFPNKKYTEQPGIVKAPNQQNRLRRQASYSKELNENNLFSSNIPSSQEYNQEHISDIKEEISKLQSLVQILKDQRSIVDLLNEIENETNDADIYENTTNRNNSTINRIQTDFANLNDNEGWNEGNKIEYFLSNLAKNVSVFEKKLDELNYFVKHILLTKLNAETTNGKEVQIYFQNEITKQRQDLLKMKRIILNLFKKLNKNYRINSISHNLSEDVNDNKDFGQILKELKRLEKNISMILNEKSFPPKNTETVAMYLNKMGKDKIETSVEDPLSTKSRISDEDDEVENDINNLLKIIESKELPKKDVKENIDDLLKELDQSDNEDSIEDLLKELSNKKDDSTESEVEITEALIELSKLLNKNLNTESNPNRIVDRFRKTLKTKIKNKKSNDEVMAKILRRLLNKPQSKNLDEINDDDRLARLKELSNQINHLPQKDDNDAEENQNFETLIQKLITQSSMQNETAKKPAGPKLKLTNNQISKLINKLTAMQNEDSNIKTSTLTKPTKDLFDLRNILLSGTCKCEILPCFNKLHSLEISESSQSSNKGFVPPQDYNNYFENPYKFNRHTWPSYRQISNSNYEMVPNKVYNQNYLQPYPAPNFFPDYRYENVPTPPIQNFPNSEGVGQYFDQSYVPQYLYDSPENSLFNRQKKIKELEGQLNNLRVITSDLQKYGQNEGDIKVLDNLNKQINDLQYVTNILPNDSIFKLHENFQTTNQEKLNNNAQNNNYIHDNNIKENQLQYMGSNKNLINNQQFPNTNLIQPRLLQPILQPNKISDNQAIFNLKGYEPLVARAESKNILGMNNTLKSSIAGNHLEKKIKRSTNEIDSEKLTNLLIRLLEDGLEDEETVIENDGSEDIDQQNNEIDFSNEETFPKSARSSIFQTNRHISKKRIKKFNVFDKLFTKILDKIIDKLTIAVFRVIERLFGLNTFYANFYPNYPYGNNMIQTFRNFGIMGYIPLFIIKNLYSLSALFYQLQKSPFIKNFLVPGGIVGLVAAFIVFLIYWFQPNYYSQEQYLGYQIQPYNTYDQHKNSQYSYYSKPSTSYGEYRNPQFYPIPRKSVIYPLNNYYNKQNMYRNSYPGNSNNFVNFL